MVLTIECCVNLFHCSDLSGDHAISLGKGILNFSFVLDPVGYRAGELPMFLRSHLGVRRPKPLNLPAGGTQVIGLHLHPDHGVKQLVKITGGRKLALVVAPVTQKIKRGPKKRLSFVQPLTFVLNKK